MKEKGIVIIIISILIMVVALTTTVYAWFSLVEKTQPIIIYSGKIELDAKLYDEQNNQITSLTIDKVVPGDEYSYFLVIKNQGTLLGDLDVLFNFKVANNNLKSYIIFTIEDEELFTGSTTFNSNSYLYTNQLDKNETITIYFKIKISDNLEVTHLAEDNTVEIKTIQLQLTQST